MKRYLQCCAVLLCALLILSGVPSAQAAGTVYFTAVNETVLKLTDATMPFWSNGRLYVSSDMFADKELGVTYYHNVLMKTATLYDEGGALQFDLEKELPPTEMDILCLLWPLFAAAECFSLWRSWRIISGSHLHRTL